MLNSSNVQIPNLTDVNNSSALFDVVENFLDSSQMNSPSLSWGEIAATTEDQTISNFLHDAESLWFKFEQ